jgi:3-hydroxyisobutyrate dehydrogenase-like beta-hydroxyacid dehydrogenase
LDFQIASGVKPVRRLIDSSNIDPGAAAEMNCTITGQRHRSTDAPWLAGVFL